MLTPEFPFSRGRRLRKTPALRAMLTETHLHPAHLVAPLFIVEGEGLSQEIAAMPGYYRHSLDRTLEEVRELYQLGIRSVLLFVKVPEEKKDNTGDAALNPHGLMPRAISAIKKALPDICVMTDVALDPYSSYGHDGLVADGQILNDETVAVLANMALLHAQAGADVVAPSDMMDGRIRAIRNLLESNNFLHTGILSYAAKYASCFYGPFRAALDSAPGFGDKQTYQMQPANRREAIREAAQDLQEGADLLMVKPGMPYLDILRDLKNELNAPLAVYQVSGEYAMLQTAASAGLLVREAAILESLLAFRRAGADLIVTYFAKDAARLL